ncbi:MAG: hypothetical protein NTY01_06880 [Verrucomicrobia bacterium]|nr:hypothetical protein [Verrucomicrobiota bacterium]
MNEFKILRPEKEVTLACGPVVTVGALCWGDALEFVPRLTAAVIENAALIGAVSAGGAVTLKLEHLQTLLIKCESLRLWVFARVVKFAGRTLSDEEQRALPVEDMLWLVDSVLEVNLSENALAAGKALGGRFAALAPKRLASAPSTPSSSATATAAKS